jgi:hypothetical protein
MTLIHQIAKRVFKTAWLDLPVEVDRQEFQAFVDRFETGHSGVPLWVIPITGNYRLCGVGVGYFYSVNV